MPTLFIVAVGLLFSAVSMLATAEPFFQYWLRNEPFHAWALAITTISPPLATTMSANMVSVAVFVTFNLGIGLIASLFLHTGAEIIAKVWMDFWRATQGTCCFKGPFHNFSHKTPLGPQSGAEATHD